MVTRSVSYTLRASSPQPLKGECATLDTPAPPTIGFVLCSNDMIGLGGEFVSASYTAQRFIDPDTGGIVFTATETRREEVIDEDEVPGAGNL